MVSLINMSAINGLITALSGKSASGHTHTSTDITDYGSGMLIQSQRAESAVAATGTTTIPQDDTIPQITEGTEFLTLAFTPKRATSTLEITVELSVCHAVAGGATAIAAVFVDTSANALAARQLGLAASFTGTIQMTFRVPATNTNARTYRVRAGLNTAGTIQVNGIGGARYLGGVVTSHISVREIAA